MFQRGQRWKKNQQQTFIDSLIKGYPVGTLLFYEKYENDQWNYILVDGLQRGSCIRSYMTNPTDFFYNDNISDEVCSNILSVIDKNIPENYGMVRTILTDFIKEQKSFKNIQFYEVAGQICQKFEKVNDFQIVGKVIQIITQFFQDKQDLYESISATTIPVNVYSGPEETLPEIFERINSKGTPLDQYEIYAAAWPVNNKFTIHNSNVIEYVVKKYDTLVKAGYTIHGYNREDLRQGKKVNAFEYLFGLSRYLVNEYGILSFGRNITDDAVNPLAFELVNACLNDTDRIRILYNNLEDIDVNSFEAALVKAIRFVNESISIVTRFKGNVRNTNKTFHSKYQIMSMISTSFKEMYPNGDYSKTDDSWNDKKQIIARNLVQYYVYLFPVIYTDKRTDLSRISLNWKSCGRLTNEELWDFYKYGLLSKSLDWRYQQEWRLISLNNLLTDENYNCSFFKIKKVYLGNKMTAEDRLEIINICKENKIPYRGVTIASDQFKMQDCSASCEDCIRVK